MVSTLLPAGSIKVVHVVFSLGIFSSRHTEVPLFKNALAFLWWFVLYGTRFLCRNESESHIYYVGWVPVLFTDHVKVEMDDSFLDGILPLCHK